MSRRRNQEEVGNGHDDCLFKSKCKFYSSDQEAREAEEKLVESVELWNDPDFPANGSALYVDPNLPPRGSLPPEVVVWNRISQKEIAGADNPQTFLSGTSACDVIQGQLGDCWYISGLSVLAARPPLVRNLIVSDKNRDKGIYTIKYSKNGIWVYVHIDDYLPCDRAGKPIYARSPDPNEMWVALLEKAYAKLHGCYQNLTSGWVDCALRDMTGSAAMPLKFSDKLVKDMLNQDTFFSFIKTSLEQGSMMGCSMSGGVEKDTGMGILSGHAYGILEIEEVEEKGDSFRMLHVRNPWGMGEWRGDWSDSDFMWEDYPAIREKLNPGEFVNDGKFWMQWEDFKEQFDQIFICYDFPPEWTGRRFRGSWIPGSDVSGAGGMPKFPTFPSNPQYGFTVHERSEIVPIVSQMDVRWQTGENEYKTAIGFVVVRLTDDHKRCHKFAPQKMAAMSRSFAPTRTIANRFTLDSGRYVIIPCTFNPGNVEEKFVLEIFSEKELSFDQEGDQISDMPEGEDSDDEGEPEEKIEDLFHKEDKHETDPEEEGRELLALQSTVADLVKEVRALAEQIKQLESRVG